MCPSPLFSGGSDTSRTAGCTASSSATYGASTSTPGTSPGRDGHEGHEVGAATSRDRWTRFSSRTRPIRTAANCGKGSSPPVSRSHAASDAVSTAGRVSRCRWRWTTSTAIPATIAWSTFVFCARTATRSPRRGVGGTSAEPAGVLQQVERSDLGSEQCGFESRRRHQRSRRLSRSVTCALGRGWPP